MSKTEEDPKVLGEIGLSLLRAAGVVPPRPPPPPPEPEKPKPDPMAADVQAEMTRLAALKENQDAIADLKRQRKSMERTREMFEAVKAGFRSTAPIEEKKKKKK